MPSPASGTLEALRKYYCSTYQKEGSLFCPVLNLKKGEKERGVPVERRQEAQRIPEASPECETEGGELEKRCAKNRDALCRRVPYWGEDEGDGGDFPSVGAGRGPPRGRKETAGRGGCRSGRKAWVRRRGLEEGTPGEGSPRDRGGDLAGRGPGAPPSRPPQAWGALTRAPSRGGPAGHDGALAAGAASRPRGGTVRRR